MKWQVYSNALGVPIFFRCLWVWLNMAKYKRATNVFGILQRRLIMNDAFGSNDHR